MRLNEGVEWGLHCVVVLAALPAEATLPTRTLAEYHGLSETYLAKHLQALANARIIESVPGPKGGYRLTRPPEKITLLEIVDAIDGREPVFRCMEIRQRGPLASGPEAYKLPCGIHVAMAKAEKAWRDALRSQTVADIVAHYKEDVAPEKQREITTWMGQRARNMPKPG